LNLRIAVEIFGDPVADGEGTIEEKAIERGNVVVSQRPIITGELGSISRTTLGSLRTIFDCAAASGANAALAATTVPPVRNARLESSGPLIGIHSFR
jgi:hypothetical protein